MQKKAQPDLTCTEHKLTHGAQLKITTLYPLQHKGKASYRNHPRTLFFAPKFLGISFLHLCEIAPCR